MLLNGTEVKKSNTARLSALSNKIQHYSCNESGKWQQSPVKPHGKIKIQVEVCQTAFQKLQLDMPHNTRPSQVTSLADSRAQMCVADITVARRLNLKRSELLNPYLNISVADNGNLKIVGVSFLTLTAATGRST